MSERYSAEPGRKSAYSEDIRWRVVWQKIALDYSYRNIAQNLNISTGTAYNVYRLFERTGNVDPKTPPVREDIHKLDTDDEFFVISMVLENPSLQLGELCAAVQDFSGKDKVSASTVCRLLKRNGLTRKKIQRVALQRSATLRGMFMSSILMYGRDMLVWVDETGCNRKDFFRKYGYSYKGYRAHCHSLLQRGQRINAMAALSSRGVLDVKLTSSNVNGDIFCQWIKGDLIPYMLTYDGLNPLSILLMDNCSVHHVDSVKEALREVGILVRYLPPYSPDFNPCEESFSFVKAFLKDHEELMDLVDPSTLIQAAFENITVHHCNAWISDCGYQ